MSIGGRAFQSHIAKMGYFYKAYTECIKLCWMHA